MNHTDCTAMGLVDGTKLPKKEEFPEQPYPQKSAKVYFSHFFLLGCKSCTSPGTACNCRSPGSVPCSAPFWLLISQRSVGACYCYSF